MELEHPGLPSFEAILRPLHGLVFEGGVDALQRAGLLSDTADVLSVVDGNAAVNRRFIRGCHYAWDVAQRRIAELVVSDAAEARRLKQELRADLRNRDRQRIDEKRQLVSCLQARQVVLRRLADTILYHMVKMQTWILRHILLEYRIREIDPLVLTKTVRVASELNREERLNFHLAADLTTVVQVGDLVQVKFAPGPPEWGLVELKEGRMNLLLNDVIEKAGGELRDEHLQHIREQFGAKAASQAKRIVRQRSRQREFTRLVTTDEGIDIMHNVSVRLTPEAVGVRDYGETLRKLCVMASSSGAEVSVVDGCLRLVALNRKTYQLLGRMGIAHLLYHLQSGVTECTLRRHNTEELKEATAIYPFFDLVGMNVYAMWPPPIFLWHMPGDLIFDLLFGRVFAFAQLDFGRLFDIAREQGIEMRWAGDREVGLSHIARVIPGSRGAKGVRARLLDSPEPKEQTLLNGSFARVFLEFMSPSQWLELVRAGFQDLPGPRAAGTAP